jgi:large subunit ribosomal protein L6
VTVEGPKGKLSQSYIPEVEIAVKVSPSFVTRKSDSKQARAYHGLYRNLVNNMVSASPPGFKRPS